MRLGLLARSGAQEIEEGGTMALTTEPKNVLRLDEAAHE
jgi:hypothetical protein